MDIFLSVIITLLLSILVLGSLALLVLFIIEKVMKYKIKKNNPQNPDNNSGDVIENKEEDNN